MQRQKKNLKRSIDQRPLHSFSTYWEIVCSVPLSLKRSSKWCAIHVHKLYEVLHRNNTL